ncbi:MAG: hypothetical protein JOY84_07640 [Curvibacter sp.]|nr:hypothetical protein [Curvibacter sp.]
MNRLQTEIRRLYGIDAETRPGMEQQVRGLVLELARPADWKSLSRVWQGVQADLGLPAPAIAVNGRDGYQLWFSLDQAVPLSQAQDFLESLRQHYLPDVDGSRLRLLPGETATLPTVPAPLQEAAGNWSAFVAPDLAAVFQDDPWLDLPPGDEAQADLLSRLRSTPCVDLVRATQALAPQRQAGVTGSVPSGPAQTAWQDDPRRFLLQVMNDPGADLALRIEAAKALL